MNYKNITIKDIAKQAKVSEGTVDRVIHNRGKVAADKKKKIEDVIKELNFIPNLLARALVMKNHITICSLFPETFSENDYWNLLRYGVEQCARKFKDYGLFLEPFYFSLFNESSIMEQANRIIELKPDGVILSTLFRKESILFLKKLEKNNIPCIFIDGNIPGQKNLSYIGPDAEQSGFVAGKLLNSILFPGDHILVVNIAKEIDNTPNLKLIEQGFRNYFKKYSSEPEHIISTLVINSTDETIIFQELTKFYIKNPNIKGVFVTNSKAHMVAHYHKNHDLNIHIIGFDLVKQNIDYLKEGRIDWIISKRPIQQGVIAVKTLFDLFIYKKEPKKIQYVPLDIIISENVDYYIDFQ